MTFSEKSISFFRDLDFEGELPQGIRIMNPFRENPYVLPVVTRFFSKFYNDSAKRHIIIGINPGRFGAGSTGIPFTDTKRLSEKCGLSIPGLVTHETSSAFIYEMIDAYGGVDKFYSDFYVTAVSPLGFTKQGRNRHLNYNYYDSPALTEAVSGFIKDTIKKQLDFGIYKDTCFCLGTGKNFRFLTKLNDREGYFGKIVPLEHPRFIMQYKSKQKEEFIRKYIEEFQKVKHSLNPG